KADYAATGRRDFLQGFWFVLLLPVVSVKCMKLHYRRSIFWPDTHKKGQGVTHVDFDFLAFIAL
ncbi:hypothetical protein KX458_26120, partial [Escherichia coli]|nr:hypothetical protein [Escherichia coli]